MTSNRLTIVVLGSMWVLAGCGTPGTSEEPEDRNPASDSIPPVTGPPAAEPVAPLPWEEASRICSDLSLWDAAAPEVQEGAARAVAERIRPEPDLPAFRFLRMEVFEAGGQRHRIAVFLHARTGMEFSLVPGGKFVMGSPPEAPDRGERETAHEVTLWASLVSRTEVMESAWSRIRGKLPEPSRGEDFPVVGVRWHEAADFAQEAGLSLPPEAVWERACRSGSDSAFYWGDDPAGFEAFAWLESNSGRASQQVSLKKPNAFGLHDMSGNAWEWCLDWLWDYPEGPVVNPFGPGRQMLIQYRFRTKPEIGLHTGLHVNRGGAADSPPKEARSAARAGGFAGDLFAHQGFRLAYPVKP